MSVGVGEQVLGVPRDHAVLWQKSLTDGEISGVLSKRLAGPDGDPATKHRLYLRRGANANPSDQVGRSRIGRWEEGMVGGWLGCIVGGQDVCICSNCCIRVLQSKCVLGWSDFTEVSESVCESQAADHTGPLDVEATCN